MWVRQVYLLSILVLFCFPLTAGWLWGNPRPDPPTPPPPTTSSPSASTPDRTQPPTTTPTKQPSKMPSSSPSLRPSAPPTKIPMQNPTENPTTQNPTDQPTAQPVLTNPSPVAPSTLPPTKQPSKSPTRFPTNTPSKPPTTSPTKQPTGAPSKQPSPPPSDSPTRTPTSSPTKKPSNSPSKQPTNFPTKKPTNSPSLPTNPPTADNETIFPILVISDVENKWKGHNLARSEWLAKYIRDVPTLNEYFDNEWQSYKIDPKLILYTGDISHYWGCHNPPYRRQWQQWISIFDSTNSNTIREACRSPAEEFNDIWQQIYDAGIPMIAAYGNHDWRARIGTGNPWSGTPTKARDEETDAINRWSHEFTKTTYQKAISVNPEFEYQEIPPTGAIGQSMYSSTFKGIQIASFNAAYNWQSYDDGGIYPADVQFNQLAATLDRNIPTLFFSHFPISDDRLEGQTPARETVISLIQEFPSGSHHFAGHYHRALTQHYDGFNDYIVPYPHTFFDNEPGYLAILVSNKRGVLQVKTMTIPGLEDGAECDFITHPNDHRLLNGSLLKRDTLPSWSSWIQNRIGNILGRGSIPPSPGRQVGNGCDRCKAGKQYQAAGKWFCGDDPATTVLVEEHEQGEPKDSLDGYDMEDWEY